VKNSTFLVRPRIDSQTNLSEVKEYFSPDEPAGSSKGILN